MAEHTVASHRAFNTTMKIAHRKAVLAPGRTMLKGRELAERESPYSNEYCRGSLQATGEAHWTENDPNV